MPKNKYTSRFKVEAVLEGLRDPDGIAAYCRRNGISDVSFYQWQKQMLANADALFDKPPKSAVKRIERLEQALQRKDRIIAIVTEEALELKKKLMT
jgi:transposase